MIMIERRRSLGYSMDKVSRLSGLPRSLIINLETGVRSLRLLPFYQGCKLAETLEVPLDVWYTSVMSPDYFQWLRGRKIGVDVDA